ncbi:MAG: transcription elongation factor GreA [Blastocatellia bacterium]|nr:transcription elongation factor GreA [Blastocatellia bacterium]
MQEIKAKIQAEIDELDHALNFEIPKVIQHAREFGDLSENAEYKAAKERQSMVQARLSLLHQRMMEVDSIDISKIPTDRIAYGSVVVLYDLEKEEKVTYELLTSEESDPDNGKISTVSPIGSALMGKEEGDEIKVKTPTGFRSFEITRVTTIHEK